MIKEENNCEKENEKLFLFLKKQGERIEKLKKKCNGYGNCNGKKQDKKTD